MKVSRIAKIAGVGVIGFCATAALADKVNLSSTLSQTAGFVGAIAGTLMARWRARPDESPAQPEQRTPDKQSAPR